MEGHMEKDSNERNKSDAQKNETLMKEIRDISLSILWGVSQYIAGITVEMKQI